MSATSHTDVDIDALNDAVHSAQANMTAGRHQKAIDVLEDAISAMGRHPVLLHYQGHAVFLEGDHAKGLDLVEEALALNPNTAFQLCDYAVLLIKQGRLKEAETHLARAVELEPEFSYAVGNLGGLYVLQEKYPEGIKLLQKAAALQPNNLEVQRNLGQAYLRTGQTIEAVDRLFAALAVNANDVGTHLLLAHALFLRDRFDTSEYHARRALELAPGAHQAKLFLAQALAAKGAIDEAASLYEAIIGKTVSGIPAIARLAQLRKVEEHSTVFQVLSDIVDDLSDLMPEGRTHVFFAAGKAYRDLGDPAKAFHAYKRGNDILAEIYPYDTDLHAMRDRRMRDFCTPEFFARTTGSHITDVAPVFICGMPRSGTTLLQQMFSIHPEVQSGGEMLAASRSFAANTRLVSALEGKIPANEITSRDLVKFGEDYVAFIRREGVSGLIFTDKMPANYRYVGLLAQALPRAKFLIMRRHPMDCLLSNYFQNFGRNQPSTSRLDWLAASYNAFDETAKAWRDRLPDRVRFADYEALVADPEKTLRSLTEFVGLTWDARMLDFARSTTQVGTASLSQVRSALYSDAVGRWRAFAPYLSDMARGISDHLSAEEAALCGLP